MTVSQLCPVPKLPLSVSSGSAGYSSTVPICAQGGAGPLLQVAALTAGIKPLLLPQRGLWGSLQLFILFLFSK